MKKDLDDAQIGYEKDYDDARAGGSVGFASEHNFPLVGFCPRRQLDIWWLRRNSPFLGFVFEPFAILLVFPQVVISQMPLVFTTHEIS